MRRVALQEAALSRNFKDERVLSTWEREDRELRARVCVRRVGWQLKVIEKTGDGSFTLLYDTPDGERTVRHALWHGCALGLHPKPPTWGPCGARTLRSQPWHDTPADLSRALCATQNNLSTM